jgi:hypothetical protein
MCLQNRLVVTRPEHAVLKQPFLLRAPFEEDTPAHYLHAKPELGSRISTYSVFPSLQPVAGVMPTHFEFEDAPDAEVVAGGIHTRHPDSPSIARHGAFVSWGFEGSPAVMTEEGRRLFLNTMAYAYAHRGERPVVLVKTKAREISGYPRSDWPYLCASSGERPMVDPEARALGVANDSLEFLGALADRLRRDSTDQLSLALLARYVPEAPAHGFEVWLADHAGDLFFSDWGGYRWYSRRAVAAASAGTASTQTDRR